MGICRFPFSLEFHEGNEEAGKPKVKEFIQNLFRFKKNYWSMLKVFQFMNFFEYYPKI